MNLRGRHIVLGVTGGICRVQGGGPASRLVKAGALST